MRQSSTGAFETNLAPQYKPVASGFEHDAATDPVLFSSDGMLPSDIGTVEQTSDDNIFMMPEATDIDYQQLLADLETSSSRISGDMFPVSMMSWYDANKVVEPKLADNVVSLDLEFQNMYFSPFNEDWVALGLVPCQLIMTYTDTRHIFIRRILAVS